jgi:hypothetical protein
MNDPELRFPEWQVPLQDLILEFDRELLPAKMQDLENRILARLQLVAQNQTDTSEQDALIDGLSILRILKRDKLLFPDGE